MADLQGTFGKPFAEQVAAYRLRLRRLAPSVKWDDLWQAEHDKAFMVAGALKADLLADLAAAVDRAISEGSDLMTFRRDFRAIVERNGWHGWTGEGSARGEAWRTRVIYKTNMATSYAAGRMAQLVESKFEFWIYQHGNSVEPREQHLAWHGLVLPPDHPFWATHAPPNGWGCSCFVLGARSMKDALRRGGKSEVTLAEGWDGADPRTGAPPGIDRGWAYAPGASTAATVQQMAAKSLTWPYQTAKAYMRDVPETVKDDFATSYRGLPSLADSLRRFARKIPTEGPLEPVKDQMQTMGLLTRAQASAIEDASGVNLKGRAFDFALDPWGVRHALNRHSNAKIEQSRGQRPIAVDDFALLPQVIANPDVSNYEGRNSQGVAVWRFEKVIGGERYVLFFDILPGRQRLTLTTMYVAKK